MAVVALHGRAQIVDVTEDGPADRHHGTGRAQHLRKAQMDVQITVGCALRHQRGDRWC
jgi:hypothetical protein